MTEKQVEAGRKILEEIKEHEKWIKSIKDAEEVKSIWVGGVLVHLRENQYTSSPSGVCTTDEEVKKISEFIKDYLVNKLTLKKIELEEAFRKI